MGLHRGGRQFIWRQKHTSLVNKCLLGQAEIMGHREDSDLQALASFSQPTWSTVFAVMFLEQALYVSFFRQLGRSSKFLPESFGLGLFSAGDNLYAKEIFGGGKFCGVCGLIMILGSLSANGWGCVPVLLVVWRKVSSTVLS